MGTPEHLFFAVVVALSSISDFCCGLQNVTLSVFPSVMVQRGGNVTLMCHYDLEGSALYAVKWYRGRFEFYRYSPSADPTQKIFLFPGVKIDMSKSNASQVVLSEVGFTLSGNICCEVTTEGPGFGTAFAVKEVTIVDLPKNGPTIATNKTRYEPGDLLMANCTSAPSKPQADLSFYINDILMDNEETNVLPGPESLSWSLLVVNVTLLSSHFNEQQGALLLKCTAVIDTLYRNSTIVRIPYRKEPIPERVTSRSIASVSVYNAALPLPWILLLVVYKVIIVDYFIDSFII